MERSMDSSGVAPRNSVEQEETSVLMEMDSKPMEWTDEKHSLFLNSMESTFVNQLYASLDSFGWQSSHSSEPCGSISSNTNRSNIPARPGKFKATRDDGAWSNNNFDKDELQNGEEEESSVPLPKPPVQQYRSQERRAIRKSSQYHARSFHVYHKDSLGGNTEASGQNFNDEDLEEKKSSRIHKKNRNLIC